MKKPFAAPFIFFLSVLTVHKSLLSNTVEAGDDFIRIRGVHFLLNGIPFYANGFNAYWLMYMASDPSQRYKVTNAFREAATHGLTVVRTWAFSDGGYRPLQYSPGSYNEQMFRVCLDSTQKNILFTATLFSLVQGGVDWNMGSCNSPVLYDIVKKLTLKPPCNHNEYY